MLRERWERKQAKREAEGIEPKHCSRSYVVKRKKRLRFMSTWTGDRKRIKPSAMTFKKTLVAHPELFLRRNKRGEIDYGTETPDWSPAMLQQASEAWEEILIFVSASENYSPSLAPLLQSLGITNITILTYPAEKSEIQAQFMKQCLIERGARIKTVRNPREVTHLNMRAHIDAQHIHWAGANDHKKAKIDLDKPKTFKELQSERKTRASW